MKDGGDKLHLLLHSLGKLFDLEFPRSAGRNAPARIGAAGGLLGGDALITGEEDQVLHDLHLLVEAALFGQIADTIQGARLSGWPKMDRTRSPAR